MVDAHTRAWLALAASVLAEVLGNLALRHAAGFSRLWPAVAVACCYACAIWLMSVAVKRLEMGMAYAIWAGAGTAITALLGMACFDETTSAMRLAGLACIVVGVALLQLSAR